MKRIHALMATGKVTNVTIIYSAFKGGNRFLVTVYGPNHRIIGEGMNEMSLEGALDEALKTVAPPMLPPGFGTMTR